MKIILEDFAAFVNETVLLEVTALLRISRSTTLWHRYASRRLQPFFQITFLIYACARPLYPRAPAFPIYMQMPPHERCNWT